MLLIKTLILKYCTIYGIDSNLALSIIEVESNFNPNKVGKIGEVGLFQIRPEFVNVDKKKLFDIETNIKTGIQILHKMKKHCSHKEYIVCYNMGVTGAKNIKYPQKFPYYKKVMKVYETYR